MNTEPPAPGPPLLRPRSATLLLLPVIYFGFVSLGLPDGAVGVAWPRMHLALGLPVGLAGTLVMVTTLFAAASSFSSGHFMERLHTGRVVLVSCAITGSALLLLGHAQGLKSLWLAAIPLGLGAGAVDAGLNGYVARHYSGRHMNWLHACWGMGATLGPLVMSRAIAAGGGWRDGFAILGTVQLTMAGVFLLSLRLWDVVPVRREKEAEVDSTGPKPAQTANSEAGWISMAIFALYVAVEGTVGIWAGSILVIARGVSQEVAGVCVAAYFGSIMTGRILTGFVVERLGNRRLVVLGLVLSLGGGVMFAIVSSTPSLACALVLLGLGFAPIYPCMMHEVPRRFAPTSVFPVIARQSGAACVGGALVPAAAGWLVEQASLLSVPWVVAAGTLAVFLAVRRLDRIT